MINFISFLLIFFINSAKLSIKTENNVKYYQWFLTINIKTRTFFLNLLKGARLYFNSRILFFSLYQSLSIIAFLSIFYRSFCLCYCYFLIAPSPSTTYLVVKRAESPIGPRACSFCVLIPISAPKPKTNPSVKRVEAFQ